MSFDRVDEAVAWGAEWLRDAGVPDARTEASLLLAHATGRDRVWVVAHTEHVLAEGDRQAFADAVRRRSAGEPYQQITGVQEFYGLAFEVTPDVLVPRPDTEVIVEAAERLWASLPEAAGRRVVDVGTGSGCIAVALARRLAGARVTAVELSAPALAVARRNAARHGAAVDFVRGDLLEAFSGPFAIVAANLPYIPVREMAGLQREVRDYEPHLALVGGPDGLDIYRRFLGRVATILAPGGYVLCECGFTQSDALARVGEERGLRFAERIDDLQGIPRTVVFTRGLE